MENRNTVDREKRQEDDLYSLEQRRSETKVCQVPAVQ